MSTPLSPRPSLAAHSPSSTGQGGLSAGWPWPVRLASRWLGGLHAGLDALRPLAALAARLWVAQVFFLAGLTKLRDWGTTLDLFAYEYQVPLLPPPVAAVLGTGAEVLLPVLLVLGLGGRLAALGLSAVNVVAVLSLPDMPDAAFQLHVFWGSLLAAQALGLMVCGEACGMVRLKVWLNYSMD